jgi:hypothetical protein
MYTSVFSKYELRKMGVKISDASTTSYKSADCVGTFEEELDVKVVTKMCRGVQVKTRPRGAGTGTVTVSAHIPYDIYCDMFDMGDRDDLVEGVQGYGQNNFHKEFSIVADVYDEDDKELLLAYPRCIIQTGPNTNIENGAEEVAEIEVEISLMPDENGYCRYECIVDDLVGSSTITPATWMSSFSPEMVRKTPSA